MLRARGKGCLCTLSPHHDAKRGQSCRLCFLRRFMLLWIAPVNLQPEVFCPVFPPVLQLPLFPTTQAHPFHFMSRSHTAPVPALDLPPPSASGACTHSWRTRELGLTSLSPRHHQTFTSRSIGRWPVSVKRCSSLFSYGQDRRRKELTHCHGSLGGEKGANAAQETPVLLRL